MASSDTDLFLQSSVSTSDPIQHYYGNAKIIISALVILFFIIAFVLIFHIYTKWIAARGRRHSSIWSSFDLAPLHQTSPSVPLSRGLDKSVVDSLPVFVYNSVKMNDKTKMKKGMPAMAMAECAVCLSEFEEGEQCRFLPVCKHIFHTDCINMWFFSHTTCPLCRTSAEKIPKEEQEEEEEEEERTEREEQNEEGEGGDEEEDESSITGLLLAQKGLIDNGTREGLGFTSEINEEEVEEEEDVVVDDDDDDQRRLVEEASNSRRRWRRSFSDKFPRDSVGGRHHHHHQYHGHGHGSGVHFPARFLTWTNSHKQLATNCPDNRWLVGGRSLSHIALTIRRSREDLVGSGS